MSVLFAILLFSFLIFIHELGHFMAAKLSGVQVNEFALFMGPAIFKKQVGETLYTVRTIPIGGYCAMEGEDEDSDNPRSFEGSGVEAAGDPGRGCRYEFCGGPSAPGSCLCAGSAVCRTRDRLL